MSIDILPKNIKDRIPGCKYMYENKIRIWNGKKLKCEHNKAISDCRECGGGSICVHNKNISKCKICEGGSVCEHKNQKYNCRQCKGKGFCVHNVDKYRCKQCKGSGICIHNKRKNRCKQCKGSECCIHDKLKSRCNKCFTNPENFCKYCTYTDVRESKYYPYCCQCYYYLNPDKIQSKRFRLKENYINDFLKQSYPSITNNKTISSNCSSGKRPDWYIEFFTHSVIIECDENQHGNYTCENKRMMQIFQDLGNRPIVFIRFNPDKYKIGTQRFGECFYYDSSNKIQINENEWNTRSQKLLETIKENEKVPEKEMRIIKLFYSDNKTEDEIDNGDIKEENFID